MSRHARRTDANHARFAKTFAKAGYCYLDVHAHGGLLDFLVGSKSGRLVLFEVKNPEAPAPLTGAELRTLAMFRGSAFVVEREEEALEILAILDNGGENV